MLHAVGATVQQWQRVSMLYLKKLKKMLTRMKLIGKVLVEGKAFLRLGCQRVGRRHDVEQRAGSILPGPETAQVPAGVGEQHPCPGRRRELVVQHISRERHHRSAGDGERRTDPVVGHDVRGADEELAEYRHARVVVQGHGRSLGQQEHLDLRQN